MSLASTGRARREFKPSNKLRDVIIPNMDDTIVDEESGLTDRQALLQWLADPSWSGHMISETLHSYAKEHGDYRLTTSHSVVERYREQEGLCNESE